VSTRLNSFDKKNENNQQIPETKSKETEEFLNIDHLQAIETSIKQYWLELQESQTCYAVPKHIRQNWFGRVALGKDFRFNIMLKRLINVSFSRDCKSNLTLRGNVYYNYLGRDFNLWVN